MARRFVCIREFSTRNNGISERKTNGVMLPVYGKLTTSSNPERIDNK
jgi:hypothetical protein